MALFHGLFNASVAKSGSPVGTRASECLGSGRFQVIQTLQIVGLNFPVQVQRGPCPANRSQCLAAHLCQAGEHVLNACTCLRDAAIAALLGAGDRLVLAAASSRQKAALLLPLCACRCRRLRQATGFEV